MIRNVFDKRGAAALRAGSLFLRIGLLPSLISPAGAYSKPLVPADLTSAMLRALERDCLAFSMHAETTIERMGKVADNICFDADVLSPASGWR